jgi:hypothetical protein
MSASFDCFAPNFNPEAATEALIPTEFREDVTALLGHWPALKHRARHGFGTDESYNQLVSDEKFPELQDFQGAFEFMAGTNAPRSLLAWGSAEVITATSVQASFNIYFAMPRLLFLYQESVPFMRNIKREYADFREKMDRKMADVARHRRYFHGLGELVRDPAIGAKLEGAAARFVFLRSTVSGLELANADRPFGLRLADGRTGWFSDVEGLKAAVLAL